MTNTYVYKNENTAKNATNLRELCTILKSEKVLAETQSYLAEFNLDAKRFVNEFEEEVLKSTKFDIQYAIKQNPTSLIDALYVCAKNGLLPRDNMVHLSARDSSTLDGRYNGKIVLATIGYVGYEKILRRQPEVASVMAKEVYEQDAFDIEIINGKYQIVHKPVLVTETMLKEGKGKIIAGAYAIITLKSCEQICAYKDAEELTRIKKSSLGSVNESSPWKKFESEMCKIAVLRSLIRKLLVCWNKTEKKVFTDEESYLDVPNWDVPNDDEFFNEVA